MTKTPNAEQLMQYVARMDGLIGTYLGKPNYKGVLFLGSGAGKNLRFLYERAAKKGYDVSWLSQDAQTEQDFWSNLLQALKCNQEDVKLILKHIENAPSHFADADSKNRMLYQLASEIKEKESEHHAFVLDFDKVLYSLDRTADAAIIKFSDYLKGFQKKSQKLRIHASANKHMEIQKYHRSSNFTLEYGSTLAPKNGRFAEEHPCGFSEGDFAMVENLRFPF